MTTYTEIVESAETKARPILSEVCAQIADVQVRNRGTIGGNVCSNDPTNHLPPLMVALGATMTIRSGIGERTVPARKFFIGVYMTAAGPGELLTKITIPAGRRALCPMVRMSAFGRVRSPDGSCGTAWDFVASRRSRQSRRPAG